MKFACVAPTKLEDLTFLCYASVITEQEKCWELLAQQFDQFQTSCNDSQHRAYGESY